MKEEIKRIMRLVQEGKLSPEDAAELIDAFQSGDPEREEATASESQSASTPPLTGENGAASSGKDPFKQFIDYVENIGKEVSEHVDWNDVARQVREGAKKGVDQLRVGLDKVKEGKFNFDFFGANETRVVELPLTIKKGKTLKIDNPVGDVKVKGGADSGSVKATAKVRGIDQDEAKKRAEEYTLVIEESDHHVQIRQPDVSGLQVDLEVSVPNGVAVEVRTLSGDLIVLDTEAGAKVNANSGNITLKGLNGPIDIVSQSGNVTVESIKTPSLTLENRSGDVTVKNVHGAMNVRTASGDLTLSNCSGKSISLESVSGDVILDLVEPITGSVSVRTVNGESSVGIVDGSDCRVTLSTLRGSVTCGLDLDDEARADQHITGRLGDGSGTLDISAVNGNITMKLRDAAAV